MEKLTVTAHFHTAHRQLGYGGHCKYVHGHTWRGKITVSCEEFPVDEHDVSLDFGSLKATMRKLDHKIVVSSDDPLFTDPGVFEPEGVVVIEGRGPSVENVARHVFGGVVAYIRSRFPDRGIAYAVEVELQETDNNFFTVYKTVTI